MGYVSDDGREYWEYPKLADAGVVPQLRAEIEELRNVLRAIATVETMDIRQARNSAIAVLTTYGQLE